MATKKPKPTGYVYHNNQGPVTWDKAAWQQFVANYTAVKIEKVEVDDTTDYLISARGTNGADWKQRNLIAEAYGVHPTKGV